MKITEKIALIDAGNTAIKVAFCAGEEIRQAQRFDHDDVDALLNFLGQQEVKVAVISSVINAEFLLKIKGSVQRVEVIDLHSSLFFDFHYESPETLGIDRLCNAAYALATLKEGFGVVIDVGTCVKFDLVEKNSGYLGGSISPGIDLRYKALHNFTDQLPLLDNKSKTKLVGDSTQSCIHSGVMNGLRFEIGAMMREYEDNYSNLTFFVTGGDAKYFDIHSKNNIFADENLTLKGLYEIYRHNA